MSESQLNPHALTKDDQIYQVHTPVYEGPLDLLLQLIERAELDITKLALAQVTDQYLAYIQNYSDRIAAEEMSAFLVIASRLIQIKSETLLPRPPQRESDEEDPADALARQLIIYKRFKEVAIYLEAREEAGLQTYLRISAPFKPESRFDLDELTIEQLVEAAKSLFERVEKVELGSVVKAPLITIREKIKSITRFFNQNKRGSFLQLLSSRHRLDIVVTFLAILELTKRRLITVNQENIFGDIIIEQSSEWDEDDDFELEFGE